jgi:hypothetical protein
MNLASTASISGVLTCACPALSSHLSGRVSVENYQEKLDRFL